MVGVIEMLGVNDLVGVGVLDIVLVTVLVGVTLLVAVLVGNGVFDGVIEGCGIGIIALSKLAAPLRLISSIKPK
jgi:hypothetical protein